MFLLWLAFGIGLVSGSESGDFSLEETKSLHQTKVPQSGNNGSASTEGSGELNDPPETPKLKPCEDPEVGIPLLFLPPSLKEESENPADNKDDAGKKSEGSFEEIHQTPPSKQPPKFSIRHYIKSKIPQP